MASGIFVLESGRILVSLFVWIGKLVTILLRIFFYHKLAQSLLTMGFRRVVTPPAKLDKKIYRKIVELIKDIERSPFEGLGKPEPLKYELSGFWSRRIDNEHRLVYQVTDEEIAIAACKNHYSE